MRTKIDSEKIIKKLPGAKRITVHSELYQRLHIEKAALGLKWAQEGIQITPAFADVIVDNMNRSNRFAQLISLTIRLHPEIKPALKEVAEKDPEFLKLLEPVQQVIGKEESASSTVG